MLSGIITALVTPFRDDNRVDFDALQRLIERQIVSGVQGLICLGTTGESPVLSLEEKNAIIEFCVQVVNSRVPLYVGTGSNCTKTTVQNTLAAKELKADGALVITPYYNRPTSRGMLEHFKAVNEIEFPFIVYHHPPRCGVRLSVKDVVQLGNLKYVAGFKEGPSDVKYIEQIKSLSNISIFSGDDQLNLGVYRSGGKGTISAAANVIPKEVCSIYQLFSCGKIEEAEVLQKKITPLLSALFQEVNPQGIKYALYLLNLCREHLRLPLVVPKGEVCKAIQSELESFQIDSVSHT